MAASLILGGLFGLAACGSIAPIGGSSSGGTGGGGGSSGGSGPGTYDPGNTVPQARYPGTGFVVHEWGTNTIVVGSDGSMQRGLHHEEEDLPAFVYDRVKAGGLGTSVDVKMETPVLYFYSDKVTSAKVSVSFPKGVLTQWYPAVTDFFPHVVQPGPQVIDPVMDPHFVAHTDTCAQQYADGRAIGNGLLDWGEVKILPRDGKNAAPPDAPLDRYTWAHARAVASNPVQVHGAASAQGAQDEQFLFYRGLGNFALPVTVAASDGPAGYDGGVNVSYTLAKSGGGKSEGRVGSVFVLRVGASGGAFKVHPEGLAQGASLTEVVTDADAQPLDAYADALAKAMTAELDKTGLYHDEAVAMVNTWKRQWFRTPGTRVLYLAPQAWTDAQIPLMVDPKPDQTTRVMVIRVEVITRANEDTDLKVAAALDSDFATGQAHFKGLGRFAEPRLRRAMQILGPSKGAAALLAQIAGANTSAGFGE